MAVMHGIRHADRGNGHDHEEPTVCTTLRWREMDSNFQYRGAKAADFRSIPGIAGVSAGLLKRSAASASMATVARAVILGIFDAHTHAARGSNDDGGLSVCGSGNHIASRHQRFRRSLRNRSPPDKLGASRKLDLERRSVC